MRPAPLMAVSALARLAWLAPLAAQDPLSDWRLEGLRTGFCVQLLLDSTSDALEDMPRGYRPLAASEAKDLHLSLRSVVEGQPEFGSWSPSRLCLYAVDTIHARDFSLSDRSGRRPQLFAAWTVSAMAPDGRARELVLHLYANSERLMRSARLAGQGMREARLMIGKVLPDGDDNGVASEDDRFQVRIGKTLVTWDGRLAGDSIKVPEPVAIAWVRAAPKGGMANGEIRLRPSYARAMAGALKVEGKDQLAKALRASPTRFAGPALKGGGGSVRFGQ